MEGQTASRGVRYDIRCVMGDSVNLGVARCINTGIIQMGWN